MKVPDPDLVSLKKALPALIRDIKVYIGMDNDFEKLCQEYEYLTDTINHIEKNSDDEYNIIRMQLAQFKQLQAELICEIKDFINEEQTEN